MNTIRIYTITLTLAFSLSATAATTRVEWFNSTGFELRDFFGTPLAAGTPADFDGSRLQLGYYSLATLAAPFAGDWVPLTSLAGDMFPSSIGDKANQPAGRFNISSVFDAAAPTDLPTTNLPLSIRFYDSSTPASSTFFNAVSNTSGAWDWIAPSSPQAVVTISLAAPGITWEGGSGSDYRTTLNVPEPTSAALLLAGACLFLRRRTLRTSERNG